MDDWDPPKWLKQAKSFIDNGKSKKAAELLTEELVEKHVRQASRPANEFIKVSVARLLRRLGQTKRAEELNDQLMESQPRNISILNEKARACQEQGKINDAVRYLTKAMQINPQEPKIWGNLGTNLVRLGQTEKGMELIRRAVKQMPDNNSAWSNLFLYRHYLQDVDRKAFFEDAKQWARINAPANMAKTQHDNDPEPQRKLRVGYISPDFRRHSVTFFFEPLLDGHNREAVEVYGYGNVTYCDATTERLKNKFDHYKNIYGIDHKEVAELIESDHIDILVDLAGHSGDSSIYAMAYKPAPIQVTWLGYPDTTGMSQIDYRLTDEIADPHGSEKFYTEKLFHLPDGFLCYGPGNMMPPVTPLSALERGYITFGSFNNSTKINPFVIELWSRVLKATPDSKLLLKFKSGQDDEVRQMFVERFDKFGISPDRIVTSGWLRPPAHLELYNHVDIALDTFPYNGTTTTCQALLMGVPVISLVGDHHMSRVGLSILTSVGLEFFAASTAEQYVAKATALAAKPDALVKIRASMRDRMGPSTLCNRPLFVKNIEQAYRKMWHRWCSDQGVDVPNEEVNLESVSHVVEAETKRQAQKQIQPSVDNISDKTVKCHLKKLTQLAIEADKAFRMNNRELAARCAVDGYNCCPDAGQSVNLPAEILDRWDVKNAKIFFLKTLIYSMSFTSYLNVSPCIPLYSKWKQLEPSNPEPYFKLGILLALEAKRDGKDAPGESLELLRYANQIMQNERSAAALALAQGKLDQLELPYDIGRIHLYPDIKSLTTYTLIEQGDWFERDDMDFFRALIRKDDKILDLGANVGVYAVSAALRINPKGAVVAVEPSKATFELLNKSASKFPNMTAIHAAVSDKAGKASLLLDDWSELNKLGAEQDQGEQVQVFSVDDIAERTGIERFDIIKMDVEGHELQALAGGENVFRKNSPIVFYEIKHHSTPNIALISAFKDLGYDSYLYVSSISTLFKYSEEMNISGVLNMIAIRPESLSRLDGLVNIEQSQKALSEVSCSPSF
ncbi:FkbM family methyltransferase [Planctomycetota bacterium]